ncbi:MAG: proprotein convertase P-domain-containing protein [Deltaproteobacteria bacterium]|nr:proprotein convertase P-domain-containing protein [Deltaproteobacteria bacterium]
MHATFSTFARRRALALAAALACLGAGAAHAAVPATVHLEGILLSAGGGPAADGNYGAAFALYPQATGGTAVWSESGAQVAVKAGQFTYALGSKTPIAAATVAGAAELWLGVTVGSDPELPRVQLRSVAYALAADIAGKALALDCSGCIKAGALEAAVLQPYAKAADLTVYAKAVDLGNYAKATDLGDYVKAASLAAVAGTGNYADLKNKPALADVATTGNYGDLKGLPTLAQVGKACGTGLMVKGLKADGSLDCASPFDAIDQTTLSKLSYGLLTNNYTDVVPSLAVFDIKDNDPTGSSNGLIQVPDLGTAIELTVSVELTSKDVSGLILKLYDPENNEYILQSKSGSGTSLKATWPKPDKVVSGDLTSWTGKNPKGQWQLAVADTKSNGVAVDGQVVKWSVNIGVYSDKKLALGGNLVLSNNTQVCNVWQKGAIRWSDTLAAIQVCDGKAWFPRLVGDSDKNPAASCKQIKDWAPGVKSGAYWLDPDGAGSGVAAYQAYCDQETGGGGWTLVAKVKGNDPTMNRLNTAQWRNKTPITGQDCLSVKDENALCPAYDKAQFSDAMIRSLSQPWRNLAWGHRETYKSVWEVINAGKRIYTHNRLFGAISNLDYNGDPYYHRDCSSNAYGFLTADWSYNNAGGIVGHGGLPHGHSGGVAGASLFDPQQWGNGKSYGPSSFSTLHCVSDFAIGSGYYDVSSGKNAYAINAHWWGAGNDYTNSWNSHGLFVR